MDIKQQRIDELEAEIMELRQQRASLQEWENGIFQLEGFADSDKIWVFDELYVQARDYLQEWVSTGWEPKDGAHYIYEAVLTKMLGEKVWVVMEQING